LNPELTCGGDRDGDLHMVQRKPGSAKVGRKPTATVLGTSEPDVNDDASLGFWYRLRPRRGITDREAEYFSQRLTNFLQEREWVMEGATLRAFIRGHGRPLEDEDRIDFLAWVAAEDAIVHIGMGELCAFDNSTLAVVDYAISLATSDVALQSALTLYQLHRLNGNGVSAALHLTKPLGT